MSERDEKRGGSGVAIVGVVLMLLVAPVLYVLSIGPAALMVKGGDPPRWLEAFYYPLAQLSEFSNTFHDALSWYMELWAG